MISKLRLRLGTRGSALARWQADWVAARLAELGVKVELVYIATEGDVKSGPLGAIGGVGLFTKQIQQALLENRIDLAVHSLKDLPTDVVPGLTLAAVPARESAGDGLVSNIASSLAELPQGARIGTGSIRRRAQLWHIRPDLQMLDIRGNLDTRLRKLDEGQYDALVLAQAGLVRLGWQDRIAQALEPAIMLPAVGQGALGIEARTDDAATLTILDQLNHLPSRQGVLAERAMLAALCGGCLAPVGALGKVHAGQLELEGVVLSGNGAQRLFAGAKGPADDAEQIGRQVAEQLLSQGAAGLIAAARA